MPCGERVEARADLQGSMGGQSQSVWYQYHPAYYSFSLDNPDWNDKLGRESGDPGITTVSTNNPPHYFGFSDEAIFVTLRGITGNNRPTGDPIVNPIRVIQNLLTNAFIGEIDPAKIDTASFNAAAAAVTQVCAFAITTEKPLHQTCAELAQQCGCVYGWDGGKAVVMRLPDGAGTSVFTADESVIARQGENGPPALSYEMLPAKDICTELIAKFTMACEGPERRIARRSVEAVDELGRTVREFNAWAYQFASSVVLAVEQRLAWMLNRQRRVTFTAFLTAYHLRPGDVITVSLSNGTATYFGPVTAVVTSVKSVAADAESGQMETVEVSALCWTWDYTVTDLPDGLDSCLGDYPPEFGATGTPPGAVSSGVGISFGGYMSPWGPGGDWAPEPGEPGGESGGSGGESGGSGSGGSDSGGSDSGGSGDPSGVESSSGGSDSGSGSESGSDSGGSDSGSASESGSASDSGSGSGGSGSGSGGSGSGGSGSGGSGSSGSGSSGTSGSESGSTGGGSGSSGGSSGGGSASGSGSGTGSSSSSVELIPTACCGEGVPATMTAESSTFGPGSPCSHRVTTLTHSGGIWEGDLPANDWHGSTSFNYKLRLTCSSGSWLARVWDVTGSAYERTLIITNNPCVDHKVVVDMGGLCSGE